MNKFTLEELADEAGREVSMRIRVFTRRVMDGKMKPEEAERKIAIMSAIQANLTAQLPPRETTGELGL